MAVDDQALGQALADVATIAILQERAIRRAETLNEQLHAALTSRVIIEQAKGVLAQRAQVSVGESFNLMRGYARSHGRRLADVARDLVEHTLDPSTVITTPPGTNGA
jgi:AmiR/NasT family two-component response regulator